MSPREAEAGRLEANRPKHTPSRISFVRYHNNATRLQEVSSDTTDSEEELSSDSGSSSGALVGSDGGGGDSGSGGLGGCLNLAVGDLGDDSCGGGGGGLGCGGGGSGG